MFEEWQENFYLSFVSSWIIRVGNYFGADFRNGKTRSNSIEKSHSSPTFINAALSYFKQLTRSLSHNRTSSWLHWSEKRSKAGFVMDEISSYLLSKKKRIFHFETLLSSNSFISYYAYSLISYANRRRNDEIKILVYSCFQVSKRGKTISETIRQNHRDF